jgi:hypothetical protein
MEALVAALPSLTASYRHSAKALIALCNQYAINRVPTDQFKRRKYKHSRLLRERRT